MAWECWPPLTALEPGPRCPFSLPLCGVCLRQPLVPVPFVPAVVAPAAVPEFLPSLVELTRMHHFAHAANLHENLWKQLPAIAENIGKKVRRHGPAVASFEGMRRRPGS